MSVVIAEIEKGSLAEKNGILAGDTLISINGKEINDILDFRFYETSALVNVVVKREGQALCFEIKKGEYAPLGMVFETYLMDKQRSCRNKCIFCFIDQLAPGMRESLYFKDDDSRLSFLFGNYITLTNLDDSEVERIIQMRISPINISVHTTNPELRCMMMGNRFAGKSLGAIERFARAGISMNCQLVLCPGINDGAELERTLTDLSGYYPSIQSVACVPVGITKYRQNLYPVVPYNKDTSCAVIDIVDKFGRMMKEKHGTRVFFPADEFYIKAERSIPDEEYYEEFAQLENGVGMLALLMAEFRACLEGEKEDSRKRELTIATGVSAYPFIKKLVDEAVGKWHNLHCKVVAVENRFFGSLIDVAGLVTGQDLIEALRGQVLGSRLLIPAAMLRNEGDLFLDGVSVSDVESQLRVTVITVTNSGEQLLEEIKR